MMYHVSAWMHDPSYCICVFYDRVYYSIHFTISKMTQMFSISVCVHVCGRACMRAGVVCVCEREVIAIIVSYITILRRHAWHCCIM